MEIATQPEICVIIINCGKIILNWNNFCILTAYEIASNVQIADRSVIATEDNEHIIYFNSLSEYNIQTLVVFGELGVKRVYFKI